MKNTVIIALIIALSLMLGGCGNNAAGNDIASSTTIAESSNTAAVAAVSNKTDSEMFTDRDYEVGFDEQNSVMILLSGSTAECSSDSVKISGGTVTISDEGTYIISGTLSDGMIIVDAPDTAKPQIVLSGANITSKTSAALYIKSADKVFVTLAENTTNTLANGGSFTAIDDNNIDSALFSKDDLTLNGLGSLTVTSPSAHGIVCKDDLKITSGTYTINAASHGIDANDSVRIANATLNIDAGKDGIHAENTDDSSLGFVYTLSGTVKINAQGDGVSSSGYMQLDGGDFDITAGGGSENGSKASSGAYGGFMGKGRPGNMQPPDSSAGDSTSSDDSSSMKGLKAAGDMIISSGTVTVNSADDSIHSNASVTVNGGTFNLTSGDDGIHADDSLTISAGTITVSESYEGLEAQNIKISGGDIKIKASDDGLNAASGADSSGTGGGRDAMFGGGGGSSSSNGSIEISNGTLYINASGDGIDSNGLMSITGGTISVFGPNSGDTSILDYDSSGTISGGTFIGSGASSMTQNFSSDSTQGVIMVMTGTQSSGTEIKLTDSSGNMIATATPNNDYSCVIISNSSIEKGKTYTLTAGSFSTTVTMDSTVYGESGGMGGGMKGGMKGMR
ncbi:MAG: carbohydrate-binding domain-containing protein [Acutalibacteraceae bacterium]